MVTDGQNQSLYPLHMGVDNYVHAYTYTCTFSISTIVIQIYYTHYSKRIVSCCFATVPLTVTLQDEPANATM